MIPVIYQIEFPDGASYVGATTNFSARRSAHLRVARGGGKETNPKLTAYLRRYPVCGIYTIASGFSHKTLHLLEAQIIADRQPALNVNLVPTRVPSTYETGARPWGGYASLAQASRELCVPYRTIKRIATEFPSYEHYRKAKSVKQRSKELDVLCSYLTQQEDVTHSTRKMLHGGVFDYPKNHAARYGVSPRVYKRQRAKHGSAQSALDYLANRGTYMPRPNRFVEAGGYKRSLSQWAKLSGLRVETIRHRLDQLKWPPAQAVGFEARPEKPPLCPRHGRIEYRGVEDTLVGHCRRLGLPYGRTYSRYTKGHPLDRVFSSESER
jgi:hypothetical protein